ncbi:ligand-binding sensor domain-containing protein [Rheinheimera maricola]|uniref:Uncharacterized protein n=1 Tax=Rheinheimera maricola TaxID=2793282 RepID=A0ABS7X694_9GAMM|nr:two-component regulator propeller domain-containing protein [Rheinheimera maricola]MBZ9610142.1 hypothetical protein [Rheinheimera maricola]
MPQLSQLIRISARQLLVTVIMLLLYPAVAAVPFPPETGLFQPIGDEEQIPDNVVTRLLQDQQGFIWIGTPAGLLRYDGYRFRRYTQQTNSKNSLAGNFVIDMLLRPDGNIWVITEPFPVTHKT